jgi:aspartyl-tRNA(Asn)/glutamyl-tRNA(Gln) amidotransferase subunit A
MIGVMGRSVADAALFAAAMTGPDPHDRATLKRSPFKLPETVVSRSPRLLLFEEFFDVSSDDVTKHVTEAVDRLTAAGAKVRRARLPVPLDLLISMHTVILITEASSTQASQLAKHREAYAPGLLSQLDIGSAIPATAYVHTQRLRHRIRLQFEDLLKGVDGFILPSTSEVAPDRSTIGPRLCQTPWTILGWPVFTIPAGLGDEDLPIGLQLVGAPFKETKLIGVADWIERQFDPMPSPNAF